MSVPIDRQRAIRALKNIQSVDADIAEGYKVYIKGVPAQILTLGLGQTLATLLDRGGDDGSRGQGGRAPAAYHQIFDHLTSWLFERNPLGLPLADQTMTRRAERMALITTLLQQDYLILQAEALAFLEWLKKFANAFLAAGDGSAGEEAVP